MSPQPQAGVAQAQKQEQAAEARVAQAKANAIKAQLDVDRYTPLVQKDVISKQQYDAAVAQAAASNSRRARSPGQRHRPAGGHPRRPAACRSQARDQANQASQERPRTGPRPAGPGQRRLRRYQAGPGPRRSGQAQPLLLQDHRSRRRHRQQEECPGRRQPLHRPGPPHHRPAHRPLGHRQLQRNPARQDAARPATSPSRSTPSAAASSPATSPRSAAPPAPRSPSSRPRTPPATTSKSSSASPSASTSPTSQKENGDYVLRPGFSVVPSVAVKTNLDPSHTHPKDPDAKLVRVFFMRLQRRSSGAHLRQTAPIAAHPTG